MKLEIASEQPQEHGPVDLMMDGAKLLIDGHKLGYHQDRLVQWKETGDCFPIYLEIGLTNRCNHQCTFCAVDWVIDGNRDAHTQLIFNTPALLRGLDSMAECGVKSIMYAGEGEPTLHKDFSQIIKHTKSLGIDVALTSNGVLYNKQKADDTLENFTWTRFSVNAGNNDTYARIHRVKSGEFDKVIRNLTYMAELKKQNGLKTTIGVQSVVLSDNLESLEDLARTCRDIGIDNLQLKPYSRHPGSIHSDFREIPPNLDGFGEKMAKYNTDSFQVVYRTNTAARIDAGIPYPTCHGAPFYSLIDSKGNIMVCNLDYDKPESSFGNLNEYSFKEIWQGQKRKDVLARLLLHGVEGCRVGCRLDPINRDLYQLSQGESPERLNPKGPLPLHSNFI